ncbi:(S)-ureidoglycine aminohydrolase [Acidicapsa acidisoli]|uniref:(S)-ureidoglycine aminohydrolase n=1 Tax=Acidicapsa acidisoli TaxID=1615681 RepID=UPI0021DFD068|nr:(S)-ureidoglycine aminohydrolase [Acidicapsa acidisoli]
MPHGLGNTRSSLKADHLLQTPDTFIRTPLPGANGVEFVVHTGSRLGTAFTQMTAEFARNGSLAPAGPGVQRFVYVLDGLVDLEVLGGRTSGALTPGGFAYIPADGAHQIRAREVSRAVVIEKRYTLLAESIFGTGAQANQPEVVIGDEAQVAPEALGGDEGLQVRHLMPDGPGWDFAVNTMTYDPGAALAMVEIHVMEHGLFMLEGGGIYRLGDSWYPVTAGDFIWMAPYCPQWFGAIGKTPAKYLIYKDWYRHPLAT